MKQLAPLLLCAFSFACGGLDEGPDAVSDDAISGTAVQVTEGSVFTGCNTVARLEVTKIGEGGGARIFRLRAANVGANSLVRFDFCEQGTFGNGCSTIDDGADWHFLDRQASTQGPNGHFSATSFASLPLGQALRFRAKEARGSAGGEECAYTYSGFYR